MSVEETGNIVENTLADAVEQHIDENQETETPEVESSGGNEEDHEELDELDHEEIDDSDHEESEIKKKSSIKKLKEKMRRREESARNEAEYWKQVALEKNQNQQVQYQTTLAQQLEQQKPAMSNYTTLDEYTTALADWRWSIKEAQQQEQQAQAAEHRKRENYSSKVKDFSEKTEDFHDVMEEAASEPLDTDGIIYNTIIESDIGPQIAYYLAKNPDEVRKIREMSPQRRLLQLGKIEAKLENASAPAASSRPAKASAPAPVKPVTGKSTVAKTEYSMSPQELIRARNERDRAKVKR